MHQYQDINLFREGTIVDIDNIEDFQGVKIERIADSGVSISGPSIRDCVVSGKSPACLARGKIKQMDKKPILNMENNTTNTENNTTNIANTETVAATPVAVSPVESPVRGKYKDALAAMQVPSNPTFTIKEVADLNKLPIPYAVKWVAEHCEEAGLAEKPAGQRGRVAKLYKKKS